MKRKERSEPSEYGKDRYQRYRENKRKYVEEMIYELHKYEEENNLLQKKLHIETKKKLVVQSILNENIFLLKLRLLTQMLKRINEEKIKEKKK